MSSNNADRIKKWREQNRQSGGATQDSAVAHSAMPESLAAASSLDSAAQLQVSLPSDTSPRANKLAREERLRLWRQERERIAEMGRAERLERERQRREAILLERQKRDRLDAVLASAAAPSLSQDQSLPASVDGGYLHRMRDQLFERKRDGVWRRFWFLGVLLLVSLVVLGYRQWVATPFYTATASFTVQVNREEAQPAIGILKLGGGPIMTDAFKTQEYMLSSNMMIQMEAEHGMLSHFADVQVDPISRFRSPWLLHRDPLTYYQSRVKVVVDTQEGLMRLHVQARSPELAKKFAERLLQYAEVHVNQLNKRAQADQLGALEEDVRVAEKEVFSARKELSKVQQRQGVIEPKSSAAGVYQLLSSLEAQLAEATRERAGLLRNGLDMSPLWPRLENQIASLQRQIAEQNNRLVSTPGRQSIQQGLSELEDAVSRKEIAQTRWETALRTLQDARILNLHERRYLLVVSVPQPVANPGWWRSLALVVVLMLVAALLHVAWTLRRMVREMRT
jgi:capsular polysaccharide transport system permease protein